MKLFSLLAFLISLCAFSSAGAVPGNLENNDYKITLSETMPGIDDQAFSNPNMAITITVQDKFRNTGSFFPLQQVYSINDYFLLGDTLNLIGRTSPKWDQGKPVFNLTQLNLASNPDSRQFKGLKQFSISSDNQSVLAILDGGDGKPSLVGLIRLSPAPARLGWIYAEPAGVNLLKKTLNGPLKTIILTDAVGWAADGLSAAFILTVDDGTPDAQGKALLKDYLVNLQVSDDTMKASAQPVDLSAYHVRDGGVITKIACSPDKATLFFTQANSTDLLPVDFKFSAP